MCLNHTHLQRGSTSQYTFSPRRVLHAGQLHYNTISTLLLNHRLSHAQLIHPVAQGGQVLLHSGLLNAFFLLRFERSGQTEIAASVAIVIFHARKILLQLG